MARNERLLAAVQKILFEEWDPVGVNNDERCRDEYDSYAKGLVDLLKVGADETRIAARLASLQKNGMGLSAIDEERDRRVARRLVNLAPKRPLKRLRDRSHGPGA